MLKKICFLFLFLSVTTGAAQASIIDINYRGTITFTDGNGLGYSVGDSVTGTIKIDLAKSTGDQVGWFEQLSLYRSNPDVNDMVSGYHSVNLGTSWDWIDLYDSIYNDNLVFSGDSLEIGDGNILNYVDGSGSEASSVQLRLAFQYSDIFTNDKLEDMKDVDLSSLFLSKSFGAYINSTTTILSPSDYVYYQDSAIFEFTAFDLKVSKVDEPRIPVLLTLGLMAGLVRRKLR